MLVKGVDTVIVFVTDMDRSLKWYQDTLELEVTARHGDWATFDTGGAVLALHGGAEFAARAGTQRATPSLSVDDYPAAKALLESRGCTFGFENETPGAIFGTFTDPDGTELQIIQRKA